MSEDERKKQAERVAEEATAFAERERRLAERSDEVRRAGLEHARCCISVGVSVCVSS